MSAAHRPAADAAGPLRVLGLLPYPTGCVPGQRYRIEQWAELLADHGIELHCAPCLGRRALDRLYRPGGSLFKAGAALAGHLRRVRLLPRARDFDVIYVYREATLLGPPWLERRLARQRPLVFDFDDAIYLPAASPANAWAARLKPAGKTAELCRLARAVLAGNDTLAAFARQHNPHVAVVPSTIDTRLYTPAPHPTGPRPVLGWTGSTTTWPYLLDLLPALVTLRARVDFELHVVGAGPEGQRVLAAAAPSLTWRQVPWSAAREVADLRPFDVGLMPLRDDEWSRGKCGMKALQYMALAIPPVVAPVGVNATLVQHGVNGLHARAPAEWVAALERLLADPALRARLGQAGRDTVERGYSAAVQAPRVAALLRAAAGRREGVRAEHGGALQRRA